MKTSFRCLSQQEQPLPPQLELLSVTLAKATCSDMHEGKGIGRERENTITVYRDDLQISDVCTYETGWQFHHMVTVMQRIFE